MCSNLTRFIAALQSFDHPFMEPFLSEIRIFSFNFPPKGWAFANGAALGIGQNAALFSLLGTNFGGNGQTNFLLPNYQGRAPLHKSNEYEIGQAGGELTHKLTLAEVPLHTHFVRTRTPQDVSGNSIEPRNRFFTTSQPANLYSQAAPATSLHPSTISLVGGGQSHNNLQPYLVLNFCIALRGVYPSRN